MPGNAGGGYSAYSYASKANQWKAFERLPRSVRDALNQAVRPWAPYPLWRRCNAGHFRDARQLIKLIKAWDRKAIGKARRALNSKPKIATRRRPP